MSEHSPSKERVYDPQGRVWSEQHRRWIDEVDLNEIERLQRRVNCGRCPTPGYCNDIRGLCASVSVSTPVGRLECTCAYPHIVDASCKSCNAEPRTAHEPPVSQSAELRAVGEWVDAMSPSPETQALEALEMVTHHFWEPTPPDGKVWQEHQVAKFVNDAIDRLKGSTTEPPPDVLQAHIDYHYSQEAAAESIGAVASERFHRKSAEYLESIKRGEPPGESPTKSPSTEKDGSAAVHEAASGGEVPPERTLMPDLAEAIKSGVPLVKQLRAGHETSGCLHKTVIHHGEGLGSSCFDCKVKL